MKLIVYTAEDLEYERELITTKIEVMNAKNAPITGNSNQNLS